MLQNEVLELAALCEVEGGARDLVCVSCGESDHTEGRLDFMGVESLMMGAISVKTGVSRDYMIGGGMSRYRAVDRCSRDYLSDYELGHAATVSVYGIPLSGEFDLLRLCVLLRFSGGSSEVPGSRGGARDKLIVFETMEKLSQPQKRADSAASRRYLRGGGEGVWLVHIHGLVGCGEWTMARMQEEWVMVGSAAEVAAFWSVRMCGEKETSVLRDVVDGDEFVWYRAILEVYTRLRWGNEGLHSTPTCFEISVGHAGTQLGMLIIGVVRAEVTASQDICSTFVAKEEVMEILQLDEGIRCEVEQEVREWISRRGEGETEDRGVTFYSGGAEQACDGESLEVLARIHEVTGAMWRLAEERACGAH
ncbi:hypothetical protein Tco_0452491 [Tanacetum coccineum]